jgi:signal transduction histidine kinase
MRLASKLFIGSALVIVVLAGVSGWSVLAMSRLVEVNRDIAARSIPALQTVTAVREAVRGLVLLESRYLVMRDGAYAAVWNERAETAAADLGGLHGVLASGDELNAHRDAVQAFAAYRGEFERVRSLMTRGDVDRARRLSEGPARAAADASDGSLDRLFVASEAALGRALAEARGLEARTRTTVTVALVASLLLALGAAAVLSLGMTRSLRRLSAATAAVVDGSFREPLPAARGDEIGEVARAFNQMAARLHEVDCLKQEFFSHISHDLRNPLTGIHGATQVLASRMRGPLEPAQARMVAIIDESAQRMLGMVNQILEFTRLRTGVVPLERQPVDLAKVVARTLDEAQAAAEHREITLESATSGADFEVMGDESGLLRMVSNLVNNAIKFTQAGGAVRVRLIDLGAHLALRVEDTGVGIPADALPRIFDPYRRAHRDRTGSGLGLAVVKGLVEAHGGRIVVETEVGKGSCFAVSLPRRPAAVVAI